MTASGKVCQRGGSKAIVIEKIEAQATQGVAFHGMLASPFRIAYTTSSAVLLMRSACIIDVTGLITGVVPTQTILASSA